MDTTLIYRFSGLKGWTATQLSQLLLTYSSITNLSIDLLYEMEAKPTAKRK